MVTASYGTRTRRPSRQAVMAQGSALPGQRQRSAMEDRFRSAVSRRGCGATADGGTPQEGPQSAAGVAPCWLALAILTTPLPAAAQHWTFDAREIGLGGARENTSLASTIVPERRPYRSILIPLRLIPVLKDLDVYNPLSEDFDPIAAITNILNPVHHTFDPGQPSGQVQLLNALLGFALNRDIDAYLADFLPDIQVLGADGAGAQHTEQRGIRGLRHSARSAGRSRCGRCRVLQDLAGAIGLEATVRLRRAAGRELGPHVPCSRQR